MLPAPRRSLGFLRALSRRPLAGALVLLALLWVSSARADFTPVIEHGPSSNRVDVFFLGDGYTSADISGGTYANHVQSYVDYLFAAPNVNTDPYFRYQNFFNIYRVNVVSPESGADIPQQGIYKNTALDATYRYDGVTDRLLYIDSGKAVTALNAALQGSGKSAEARFVTVNESVYGGGGGYWAVYAGGNGSSREIALHESGHSFNGLADEYDYGRNGTYSGSEPGAVNITKNASGSKWAPWLGYNDPTGSVVGAYEGAGYYKTGLYRPTSNSKMRSLGVPFNAISREKIILDIYDLVDPLDDYTNNASMLVDPAILEALTVDDDVIDTQWSIDGIYNPALDGLTSIDIPGLSLSIGNHVIELRAFDPTGFDAVNGWVRSGTDALEQFVEWDLSITVPEPATILLAAVGLVCLPLLRRHRALRRR